MCVYLCMFIPTRLTVCLRGVQKVNCAIWSVRACRRMYASMHANGARLC